MREKLPIYSCFLLALAFIPLKTNAQERWVSPSKNSNTNDICDLYYVDYSTPDYHYHTPSSSGSASGYAYINRGYDNSSYFSSGISSYQGTSTGPGPNGGYPGTPKGVYPTNYYPPSSSPAPYTHTYSH